jgi:hypothetical protein
MQQPGGEARIDRDGAQQLAGDAPCMTLASAAEDQSATVSQRRLIRPDRPPPLRARLLRIVLVSRRPIAAAFAARLLGGFLEEGVAPCLAA